MLSTNTEPEPEITGVEQQVRGRRKRVVPLEARKKPEVVKVYKVYNTAMNGVDVNDQIIQKLLSAMNHFTDMVEVLIMVKFMYFN